MPGRSSKSDRNGRDSHANGIRDAVERNGSKRMKRTDDGSGDDEYHPSQDKSRKQQPAWQPRKTTQPAGRRSTDHPEDAETSDEEFPRPSRSRSVGKPTRQPQQPSDSPASSPAVRGRGARGGQHADDRAPQEDGIGQGEPSHGASVVAADQEDENTFLANEARLGLVFWVKVQGFRWWPARLAKLDEVPPSTRNLPHKDKILVYFFAEHTYGWVSEKTQIHHPYNELRAKYSEPKGNAMFQAAVDGADSWLASPWFPLFRDSRAKSKSKRKKAPADDDEEPPAVGVSPDKAPKAKKAKKAVDPAAAGAAAEAAAKAATPTKSADKRSTVDLKDANKLLEEAERKPVDPDAAAKSSSKKAAAKAKKKAKTQVCNICKCPSEMYWRPPEGLEGQLGYMCHECVTEFRPADPEAKHKAAVSTSVESVPESVTESASDESAPPPLESADDDDDEHAAVTAPAPATAAAAAEAAPESSAPSSASPASAPSEPAPALASSAAERAANADVAMDAAEPSPLAPTAADSQAAPSTSSSSSGQAPAPSATAAADSGAAAADTLAMDVDASSSSSSSTDHAPSAGDEQRPQADAV
eukprot:TRINITY_DN3305_c0_g1_i3.p1 TRINITY_DN3305_c0_g1~~TRINITY_DN3305_c0_g1_i3.p1  ORF type:complete len:586 (+),score=227.53 TRINITY_DN3305_c0_g1_i3:153-1910(+)